MQEATIIVPELPQDLTRLEVFAKMHKVPWQKTIEVWEHAYRFNTWDFHAYMAEVPWDNRMISKVRNVVKDVRDIL